MASKKDVVRIVDEDYESKSFKTAPSGRYSLTVNKAQSKIVPGNESNVLRLVTTIKKGPHKSVNIFDNIAAHVGWKIAQVLMALGYSKVRIKKMGKELTLQKVLQLAAGKDIDAVIRETNSEEFGKQNKVVQYLPPGAKASEDDDDEEEEEEEEDEDLDDEEDDDEDEDLDEDEDEEDEDEDEEEDEDEDEEEDEDDEEEDDEEDDDEEEDEDEDDEPPTRRKPVAKKATAKKTTAKKKGR